MSNTIYNVYVKMKSQAQCDRFKKLCIDNNLRIWDDFRIYPSNSEAYLFFYCYDGDFCNWKENIEHYKKVSEKEFKNLLNQHLTTPNQSKRIN